MATIESLIDLSSIEAIMVSEWISIRIVYAACNFHWIHDECGYNHGYYWYGLNGNHADFIDDRQMWSLLNQYRWQNLQFDIEVTSISKVASTETLPVIDMASTEARIAVASNETREIGLV